MDIDIDLPTSFDPLKTFKGAIPASMVKNDELSKHPCGVYFQQIPTDQYTGLSAIPYEQAEQLGYFKIDFLHLNVLNTITSKQELRELIDQEPDWNLFNDRKVVEKLFQLGKQYELISKLKPKSVDDVADVLALMRPGKKHLLQDYLNNKQEVRKELYKKNDDGYTFKRSHAISYALTIIVQLHLIKQKRI